MTDTSELQVSDPSETLFFSSRHRKSSVSNILKEPEQMVDLFGTLDLFETHIAATLTPWCLHVFDQSKISDYADAYAVPVRVLA